MTLRDFLRYLLLALFTCVVLVVGLKVWSKQKNERRIIRELRSHLNPTAQFEQLYTADAEKTLFRSLATLHEGVTTLETDPGELLNEVFHGKGEAALFANPDPTRDRSYVDPRETLIRESLLRNYQRCSNLGVFESTDNAGRLADGEAPEIRSGPATGRKAAVARIIDPALSPGVEKLVPNMVLGEPGQPKSTTRPSDLAIKQAKSLASLLYRANLIEDAAEQRLLDHYDALTAPAEAPKR